MFEKRMKASLLDVAVLLALAVFLAWLAYRIRVGLSYNWDWGRIPQYLFRYDADEKRWVANLLMQGLFTTIRLSFWGTLLAMILGTIMGLCRVSESLFKRLLGRTYIELIRNLPPLVLVFIFYFFVTDPLIQRLGVDAFVAQRSEGFKAVCTFLFASPQMLSPFLSALVTIAFFEGAYIAEIVRAGILSVEKGQWEASSALGLSRWQLMRHVVLPQATLRILPPLAGQFISTIKDSAIVSVISIPDLTFQGMEIMAGTYLTFEIWIVVGGLYLVLTLPCSLAVSGLEKHMRRRGR